jgi:hypothetical protein
MWKVGIHLGRSPQRKQGRAIVPLLGRRGERASILANAIPVYWLNDATWMPLGCLRQ